jgi:hypothetical protein
MISVLPIIILYRFTGSLKLISPDGALGTVLVFSPNRIAVGNVNPHNLALKGRLDIL